MLLVILKISKINLLSIDHRYKENHYKKNITERTKPKELK